MYLLTKPNRTKKFFNAVVIIELQSCIKKPAQFEHWGPAKVQLKLKVRSN